MVRVLAGLVFLLVLSGCSMPRSHWLGPKDEPTRWTRVAMYGAPRPPPDLRVPVAATSDPLPCVPRKGCVRRIKPSAPKGNLWCDLAPKRWKGRCGYKAPRAELKSALLAGAGVGAVWAYGFGFWHYGSSGFHFIEEDWFAQDSYRGGADKAGHITSSHILTAVFASANRWIGFDYQEAAVRGALSGWTVMLAMEIGDGFSDEHGFSYEDIICNTIGCVFGYFHETVPWFARTFDIRWEYWPDSFETDSTAVEPTTSYGDTTFLLAINAGALASPDPNLLDFLDLQIGYEVRDIGNEVLGADRRIVYGVGLNLANVLRRLGWCRTAKIFDYYQAPFISLRLTHSLDR